MSVFFKKCILLFLLCINAVVAAEEWRNIKSLESNFKQEIKGERGAVSAIYSGKLYAANNKVKWEYTKPLKKEVYLERNTAYVYEPDIKQVTIGTLSENVDFINILKQVKKIKDNIYQTKIGDVTYTLQIKDSKPYSLSYIDTLENNVYIVFSDINMNAKIDENTFIFQPPDDVEYIDAN